MRLGGDDLQEQLTIPNNRLSKHIINVLIISEVISTIIGAVVIGVLFYLDDFFNWPYWIRTGLIIVTMIWIAFRIWAFVRPFFLYKNWRYDVDEEFLQMKSGAINEVHELVPMTKIQAVSTTQGPILRRYGLYTISVETMGTSHKIPGLPKDVAINLRNQIAVFAKIKEVEQ